MSLKEREYDEDLEELLGEEEYLEEEEENDDEIEYEAGTTTKEVSLDTEIDKNISSFMAWANATKWLMIIGGVAWFILCLAGEAGALAGIVMLVIFVICGFLYSLFLKWFGYVLKCLQEIKNK